MVRSSQDIHPRRYYQAYHAATNPEGYQGEGERYAREQDLVARTLDAAIPLVPADLDVDADGDGVVDNVAFVVSGAADGWSDLPWSHAWVLYTHARAINGAQVQGFMFIIRDQLDRFTLAHELFHTMGAPDLYHYSLDGWPTVGPWDIMESGLGHMGAWMKHRYGGWIDAVPVAQPGLNEVRALTEREGSALRVPIPGLAGEFLVVEFRRRVGALEASVPGSGLLLYRIAPAHNGNGDGPPDEVYLLRKGGTLATGPNARMTAWSEVGILQGEILPIGVHDGSAPGTGAGAFALRGPAGARLRHAHGRRARGARHGGAAGAL